MTTYYTATNGNDGNAGNIGSPFLTINHGVSVLTPGDTLLIRAGTYVEWLNNTVPGGTSWSAPVTVAAYPSEVVTVQPPVGAEFCIVVSGISKKYIIFDGLILNCVNVSYSGLKVTRSAPGDEATYIRIQNSEIKNAREVGVLLSTKCHHCEFINLDMHDNGYQDGNSAGSFGYAFYIGSSDNLVERCLIHGQGGSGIQIYNGNVGEASDNNIIRRCSVYSNTVLSAAYNKGAGINVSWGNGNQVYNNIVRNNRLGIFVNYSNSCKVCNNTVYSNTAEGIYVANSNGPTIKNNVSYSNGTALNSSEGTSNLSQGNNLLDVNPRFVNAGAGDFHLQVDSPAIDNGVVIN